jgi:hypothetical protein
MIVKLYFSKNFRILACLFMYKIQWIKSGLVLSSLKYMQDQVLKLTRLDFKFRSRTTSFCLLLILKQRSSIFPYYCNVRFFTIVESPQKPQNVRVIETTFRFFETKWDNYQIFFFHFKSSYYLYSTMNLLQHLQSI